VIHDVKPFEKTSGALAISHSKLQKSRIDFAIFVTASRSCTELGVVARRWQKGVDPKDRNL
jgi:hypothetical protein